MPDPPVRRVGIALVDDLDANGAGIEPGTPLPLAVAGMPGTAVFINQLIDRRRSIADQIVAADFAMGKQCEERSSDALV